MKSIIYLIAITILFMNACCSTTRLENDKSIRILETNCWLNLMPGGEPSFHYSGTFEIEKQLADRMKFSSVEVYYKDELIHKSQPLLQFYDEVVTDSMKVIRFNFYSEQGIKVTETMMKAESVDFHFVFEFNGDKVEKDLKEITLTRAY
ncbi:MAG: hypothetical protein HRF52_07245 [Ignavibacterium sp.]|uniref:hypothetical protein n=1 Tax=Ignavibacterium sp. TaxID=2651167 RepID=UPI0032984E53